MPSKSKNSQRTKAGGKSAGKSVAKSVSKTSKPERNKATLSGRGGKTASRGVARGARPDGKPGRKSAVKASAAKRAQGRVESVAAAIGTSPRPTDKSAELAKAAIDAALDKKALLPVLIDVSSLASYTDFIAIVSGRSDRHVDAIADGVVQEMKSRGRTLLGQEGSGSGRWTLLDFGDVVIHVFYHPVREFYDLESLWVDAPRLPLKIPPEAMMASPDALYGNL
ncbi:MAG TPA: ribosome silencing factor [Polyangia bacterium]|nr:ribosome silencing factor [Polyangia bacterium]